MSFTIEHCIIDLMVERLRDHMVSGAQLFVESEDNAYTLSQRITLGGTPSVSVPRKFELKVTALGKCSVTETTLWAELGISAPTPFTGVVDFVTGVPFQIADSGVTATIQLGHAIDDSWLVRVANACETVVNIVPHPFDFNELPTPSISVYMGDTQDTQQVQNKTDSDMALSLVLCVDRNTFEAGNHLEILGDIRDCINRDYHLWDNTTCLATMCKQDSHSLFDLTDSNSAIFTIDVSITYRSTTKNARLK